jgi:hypothetical protein
MGPGHAAGCGSLPFAVPEIPRTQASPSVGSFHVFPTSTKRGLVAKVAKSRLYNDIILELPRLIRRYGPFRFRRQFAAVSHCRQVWEHPLLSRTQCSVGAGRPRCFCVWCCPQSPRFLRPPRRRRASKSRINTLLCSVRLCRQDGCRNAVSILPRLPPGKHRRHRLRWPSRLVPRLARHPAQVSDRTRAH